VEEISCKTRLSIATIASENPVIDGAVKHCHFDIAAYSDSILPVSLRQRLELRWRGHNDISTCTANNSNYGVRPCCVKIMKAKRLFQLSGTR
jgi:hypothetical protein